MQLMFDFLLGEHIEPRMSMYPNSDTICSHLFAHLNKEIISINYELLMFLHLYQKIIPEFLL